MPPPLAGLVRAVVTPLKRIEAKGSVPHQLDQSILLVNSTVHIHCSVPLVNSIGQFDSKFHPFLELSYPGANRVFFLSFFSKLLF